MKLKASSVGERAMAARGGEANDAITHFGAAFRPDRKMFFGKCDYDILN